MISKGDRVIWRIGGDVWDVVSVYDDLAVIVPPMFGARPITPMAARVVDLVRTGPVSMRQRRQAMLHALGRQVR